MSRPVRVVVCGSIAASGVVLVGIVAFHAATAPLPLAGVVLAVFGGLIGVALAGAGVVLYRSDVVTPRVARIAGWNALGIVVIGAAMALFYAYQAGVGSPPPNPVFSGAVVVGVSAVAHVLIGVNDVRRIRASELAQERQKLAVLTRLLRHNLRTEAQLLYSYASTVGQHAAEGDDLAEVAASIQKTGDTFVETHENVKLVQEVIDTDLQVSPVDLSAVIEECVDTYSQEFPGATIETDVPDGLRVRGGEYLSGAISEVFENALTHAETDSPRVTVSVSRTDSFVVVTVTDDGPGIPDRDRRVVLGETPITQLEHASGLGLWLVRWIVDAYDGTLDIRTPDAGGTEVQLRLRPAR